MRNAFIATLTEMADKNPDFWLLCGDLGFSVLEHFVARFPDRYVNVGVAEQNMAGIAAGLALSGKTVFIYSIGNFSTVRCLEQLRNDVCYHNADVKVVAVGAGYAYGSQGYTHHAIEDVAIMSTLPKMEVFVPCDPTEVRVATRAIAASGRPSYLRLSRAGESILHRSEPEHLRRPLILREGREILMLASGPIASACITAAEMLKHLDIGVLSVPCIKPLDTEFIQEIARGARILVTVEEHILRGGLHAAIAASFVSKSRHLPVIGLGILEQGELSMCGDRDALLAQAGLSPVAIADRIKAQLALL